jgi:hypothetical protein
MFKHYFNLFLLFFVFQYIGERKHKLKFKIFMDNGIALLRKKGKRNGKRKLYKIL